MANLFENRTNPENLILEKKFIRQKLEETSQEIQRVQDSRMASFNSDFWNNRKFSVTDNQLDFEHLKVHRFVDMRRRTLKDGTKINKKSYPIHNRVVMGQYSQLTRELAYGFTEEIKNQLRQMQ